MAYVADCNLINNNNEKKRQRQRKRVWYSLDIIFLLIFQYVAHNNNRPTSAVKISPLFCNR